MSCSRCARLCTAQFAFWTVPLNQLDPKSHPGRCRGSLTKSSYNPFSTPTSQSHDRSLASLLPSFYCKTFSSSFRTDALFLLPAPLSAFNTTPSPPALPTLSPSSFPRSTIWVQSSSFNTVFKSLARRPEIDYRTSRSGSRQRRKPRSPNEDGASTS